MFRRRHCSFLLLVVFLTSTRPARSQLDEFLPPDRVRLLPICAIPKGEKAPTRSQQLRFMRHIRWSQQRYREMLSDRDTFELAQKMPDVVRLRHPVSFYKALDKGEAACHWVAELLDHYKVSRFKCPYTFCILVMNPAEHWPIGGGRTINGGINRGGGVIQMSSFTLDRTPNFQSTLLHEIGHSCGLPHVNVYGYDMKKNPSVMAYNQAHKTRGFEPSREPAILIPEDLRLLALSPLVFPQLKFAPAEDVPGGYELFPRVITLGPMQLPGNAAYDPILTTPSGEDNGTRITNVNAREILPSAGPGITFRKSHMWASKRQPSGRIVVEVSFPGDVRLTAMMVNTEHSGRYQRAKAVQIAVRRQQGYQMVASQPLDSADALVKFSATTAQDWRLEFQADQTQKICLRGLQYLSGDHQLFPPLVPYEWKKKLGL